MRLIFLIGLCLISVFSYAQEEEPPKLTMNGYIKDLVSITFLNGNTTADNLIHNRLNFKWLANDAITAKLEIRNRIFFGSSVKMIPNYGKLIDVQNDFFDLSILPLDNSSLVLHSMIDRAYLEWSKEQWEVRVGRQRINWAINIAWNPNDLFNTYSFFDFDYEERPGSDAILIRKYTGFASSIEFAGTINDDFDKTVLAAMWKFNKKGYDFQILGGKAREDISLGLGWAGNIKMAGFKGEITYFEPYNNMGTAALVGSMALDYSFKSGVFITGSVLYNSSGSADPSQSQLAALQADRLTVRNLSPYSFSTFAQLSYPIHPLVNTGMAVIFYPGNQAMFLNPTISYSASDNIGVDLVGQIFFDDKPMEGYGLLGSVAYLRGKWSF